MARKARTTTTTTTPATEAPVAVVEDTTTEAPVVEAPDTTTTDDTTETTAPEPEPVADPTEAVASAWWLAIDGRDSATGVVAPAVAAPVLTALGAVKPSKRADCVLALTTETTARAMADITKVDTGLLTASAMLAEAARTVGTAPAAPVVTDEDKREALSLALVCLSDEASATPSAALVLGEPSDEDTPLILRARAALAAVAGKRAPRASGPRRSAPRAAGATGRGSSIVDHVAEALATAGEPMKVTALVKAVTSVYPDASVRPSGGAVSGAVKRGDTSGRWVAATVDGAAGAALADTTTEAATA